MEETSGGDKVTMEGNMTMEEVALCLVCGGDLLNEVTVKTEVTLTSGENGGEDLEVNDRRVFGGDCGGEWSDRQREVLSWFLKWFEVNLGKDFEWERVPFCGRCYGELERLMDIQKQVEELKEVIRCGVEEIRIRMEDCEGIFGGRGVYRKDGRYLRVRKQIVKNLKLGDSGEGTDGKASRKKGKIGGDLRRSSARSRKSVNSGNNDESLLLPVVTMSAEDKANAEQRLLESDDIKPEPEIDFGLEEDTHQSWEDPLLEAENFNQNEEDGKKKRRATARKRTGGSAYSNSNNLEENNDDVTPSSSKRPRRSQRKTLKQQDLFMEDDNDKDSDYDPLDESPPISSKTKSKKGKVPSKRKAKDDSWTMEEVTLEVTSDDEEDDDSTEYSKRVKIYPEKGILFFRNLKFDKQEGEDDGITYQCTECKMVVRHKHSRIQHHYWSVHTTKFQCPECPFRGGSTARLRDHVNQTHLQIKRTHRLIECPTCGRPNRGTGHLKQHMWTHYSFEEKEKLLETNDPCVPQKEKRRFQCDICGNAFGTASYLQQHKLKHAAAEVKEAMKELCPECGGTFTDLKHHFKRNHALTPDNLHKCTEPGCDKAFKSASEMNKHRNCVHRKIRNFECTMCPRKFSNPWTLRNHQNLHLGIRPWKCKFCDTAFTRKNHLERHIGIYHSFGSNPKRKPYARGATQIGNEVTKGELQRQGKYLPFSALATWAQGREPTSHFPKGERISGRETEMSVEMEEESWQN